MFAEWPTSPRAVAATGHRCSSQAAGSAAPPDRRHGQAEGHHRGVSVTLRTLTIGTDKTVRYRFPSASNGQGLPVLVEGLLYDRAEGVETEGSWPDLQPYSLFVFFRRLETLLMGGHHLVGDVASMPGRAVV